MTTETLTFIIRLVILVITGFLIPALRAWIKAKTDNEKMERIKSWAETAVWAAEQLHNKAKKDDPAGTLRKGIAYESIRFMADKIGIDLTPDEINTIIECAVHELNECVIHETKGEADESEGN